MGSITRASRTTGARGINFLAISNKYQIAIIWKNKLESIRYKAEGLLNFGSFKVANITCGNMVIIFFS